MHIVRDETCVLAPGDFGAKIVDNNLHIPPALHAFLKPVDAHQHAEDLIAFAATNPTLISETFGWTIRQVVRARRTLEKMLESHVPAAFTQRTPKRRRRVYGALPK